MNDDDAIDYGDSEQRVALDEQELNELGAMLAQRAGDDGLYLDGAHGFLTAIAIGPDEVPVEQWLPVLLDENVAFDDEAQAQRTVQLLLRMAQSVVEDVDDFEYEPILGEIESESGDPVYTAHGWCDGFSRAVDLGADRWTTRMREDVRLSELMAPIVRLAADEGLYESEDGEEAPPLSENEYEEALNKLPGAVYAIHQYWREHGDDAPPPPPPPSGGVPRWRQGRSVH